MPRGGETLPAGASFGSLPIVDSTAGWRCIHSASCAQPGEMNARIAIANARLIIISLTFDAGARTPIIRIVLIFGILRRRLELFANNRATRCFSNCQHEFEIREPKLFAAVSHSLP